MATPATTTAPRSSSARPAAAPAKPASKLGSVKRGVIHEPYRYFLYGPEGVGKSSLAADAPSPIFLDTDRGSGRLDVARYPFRPGTPDAHIALTLADIYEAVDDLLGNEHDHKTLVIDTSDALEALLWKHICDHAPIGRDGERPRNVEAFGYGKGYQLAVDEWRALASRLDQLRLRRGMDIVLLGHSTVKTFKNPVGDDYDRYRPKLDDRALDFLKGWCDVVGFVCFEEGGKLLPGADPKRDRARGWASGHRQIHFERGAAWDAKSRLGMPPTVDLRFENPWAPFAEAVNASRNLNATDIVKLIEAELERLGDEFVKADGAPALAESVRKAVAATDSTTTLTKYLTGLKQAQPQETQS